MYYLFIPQNEKEFQLELSSFNLYNGYQEWDIVYPILIKFKVNNFPFKYPVAGPISFLISSWKSHAEQIFNGKKSKITLLRVVVVILVAKEKNG